MIEDAGTEGEAVDGHQSRLPRPLVADEELIRDMEAEGIRPGVGPKFRETNEILHRKK